MTDSKSAGLAMTRRSVAFGGFVCACGQSLAPAQAQGRALIDVHHHLMPPAYLAARRASVEAVMPARLDTLGWTPQWSIDHLEKTGARAAVLSLSAPGCWFGDDQEGRKLARITNDYGAQLVRDHPGRFGQFAALPWPDVPGTLKEIEYAYDVLKVDGVGFITSYAGHYPGEKTYEPIWQELNRRKAVVYFHPTTPACCAAPVEGLPPAQIEFPYDTTRAIASLMLNQVFARYTDLRFIFSHGGGALPMLANRLAGGVRNGAGLAELKRLNFDTASVTNPGSWAALTKLAPTSQILFGTDFPFGSIATTRDQLQALGVDGADMARISHENAIRLLPRFA